MRSRVNTIAFDLLAGAVWASGAAAAPMVYMPAAFKPAPGFGVMLDRTGHVVNLNLSGVAGPSFAQNGSLLRPGSLNLTHGLRFDFSQGRNWDNYGNLFSSPAALTSAYLSGTNTYSGATFALGKSMSLSLGRETMSLGAVSADQPSDLARMLALRSGADLNSIGATTANLNWNFASWGGLGVTASRSTGDAALMSIVNSPIVLPSAAQSSSLGITARVGFGEGWVTTVAYSEGVTQLDLSSSLKLNNPDPLHSQSYGIGIAKTGLFGDDALGIAISQPLQVYSGTNLAAVNSGFALANTPARESDVALGYVTTFLDGALALQANAAYQVNAAGTKGQTAVTGVARAKLNF